MSTYYEIQQEFLNNKKNWTNKELDDFVSKYKLNGSTFQEVNLELSNLVIYMENIQLKKQLEKSNIDLLIESQQKNELLYELDEYKKNQPMIEILNNEVELVEEKLEVLQQEFQNILQELKEEKEQNRVLEKTNAILNNKIVELTHQISNKIYKDVENEDLSSLENIKHALLNCSENLGIANTKIVFLKNQISKDALKISQQTRLINASKAKEDELVVRFQQKEEKLKNKHNKLKLWYKEIELQARKKIVSLRDSNILLNQENSELITKVESQQDIIKNLEKYLLPTTIPSYEINQNYKKMYNSLVDEIFRTHDNFISRDLYSLKSFLNAEKMQKIKYQRHCLFLEKEKERLLEETSKIHKNFYTTISKLEKMKENSSSIYLQKISDYQQEIRKTRETLEKNKIMYENIKLELQTEVLRRK